MYPVKKKRKEVNNVYKRENPNVNKSAWKAVLTYLYVAQIASDAAKGIFLLPFDVKGGERAIMDGYRAKYDAIKNAQKLIKEKPNAGVTYQTKVFYKAKETLRSHVFRIWNPDGEPMILSFHTPEPIRNGRGSKLEMNETPSFLNRSVSKRILQYIRS